MITLVTEITVTAMIETTLFRLLTWASPSYPIGAFSYSHGLEWLVEQEQVTDKETLGSYIADVLALGAAGTDACFLAHAHRAAAARDRHLMSEVASLAASYGATKELRQETLLQGRAFFETTKEVWPCDAIDWCDSVWSGPMAYPIAVGVAAGGQKIPLNDTLAAFLHAVTANLVSAGVRLVPLGQTDGQRVVAQCEPLVVKAVDRALFQDLDEIGNGAFVIDLASMNHETQYTRLFRS